jgi:hypothetical protein
MSQHERAFDFAADLSPSPGFLDFDVSTVSRPLMIDGVTDLISTGCSGDAGLWLLLGWTITINRIVQCVSTSAATSFIGDFEGYLREIDLATPEGLARKAWEGQRLIDACMGLAQRLRRQDPNVEWRGLRNS